MEIRVDLGQAPLLTPGKSFDIRVDIDNRMRCQQWLHMSWLGAEDFTISPGAEIVQPLEQYHGNIGHETFRFIVQAPEVIQKPCNELVLAILLISNMLG